MAGRLVFANFRLDVRARELYRDDERVALAVVAFDCLAYLIRHRDRPVGRDELISAVWGRADVSESTLAHTIVRLRQCLGDTGNDQRYIRTIPRLGYRWVAPVVEAEASLPGADAMTPGSAPVSTLPSMLDAAEASAASDDAPEARFPEASVPASDPPEGRRRRQRALAILAVVLLASAAALAIVLLRSPDARKTVPAGVSPTAMRAVMVEPSEIVAPDAWSWLRLGTMDLVANRLREGELPTLPSETALTLAGHDEDAFPAGVTMRVRPHVQRDGDVWRVRLDARLEDGRRLHADAQGREVMQATRLAADRLLLALGKTVPPDGLAAPGDIETLRQRIAAVRLDGRLPEALSLIEQAPAAWRARSELGLLEARIHCDMGHFDVCDQRLDALADRLSREKDLELYGQMRVTQAWLYANRDGDLRRAGTLLDEVVGLKTRLAGTDALGNAYSLRGWMRTDRQPDAAMADLGQARAIFLRRGNLREIARIDQRMGGVLARLGRLPEALASLRAADRQFGNLGAVGDQAITLMAMAQTYGQLLQHDDALAATDRYWNTGNARYDGAAGYRAWALMRKGRLKDAESLVASILDRPGAPPSDWMRADLLALSARIAMARGQYVDAADLAKQSRELFPPDADRQDAFNNGMVEIRALRAAGRQAAAAQASEQLHAWASRLPDERLQVGASLVLAEQAWADGDAAAGLAAYARALAGAEHAGIPELLVDVGSSYADVLITAGRLDAASEVGTRLAAWSREDVRAARVQARLLQALGNASAARAADREAARLAGEGDPDAAGNPSTRPAAAPTASSPTH